MEAVAYSTFRNNLKTYLRKTREDAAPLLVTNADSADNVVVVNARDYDSIMETLRIYENRPLYEKIMCGREQVARDGATVRELVEADD